MSAIADALVSWLEECSSPEAMEWLQKTRQALLDGVIKRLRAGHVPTQVNLGIDLVDVLSARALRTGKAEDQLVFADQDPPIDIHNPHRTDSRVRVSMSRQSSA